MDRDFWLERWQQGETAFHQTDFNPHLLEYWPRLDVPTEAAVFVPLCGKSRDMLWLASRGHRVIGVEISQLAVAQFFSEQALQVQRSQFGRFERWEADEITILAGDYFDLRAEHLAECAGVFDRASLIALPPDMRQRYARHLVEVVPDAAVTLLVTMEYPQQEMKGPPFSVSESEVHDLYDAYYNVRRIASQDIWAQTPRFQEKGLTALRENIYRMSRG